MPRKQIEDENRVFKKQVQHYKDVLFTTAKDSFGGRFDFDTFHFHRNAWENALAESLVDSYCAATKEEFWEEITKMYAEKLKNQMKVFGENTKELRKAQV